MTTAAVIPSQRIAADPVPLRAVARPVASPHIQALDGVRGLAFCLVFFQHFAGGEHIHLRAVEMIRGVGWTGVDLFFCLSGFLITGILYDTRNQPGYFRNFYARRALRIFPLYYLCLAFIFLSTPLLHLEWHWYHLCYPLYCSNFLNAFDPGIRTFGFQPWLDIGHFWSLAVEEQFYLVWPAVIFICKSRESVVKTCIALITLSIVLRCIFVALFLHAIPAQYIYASHWFQATLGNMPAPFFYRTFLYRITFFRFDALAMGGILAMLLRGEGTRAWPRHVRWMLPLLFVMSAAVLAHSFHCETPYTAIFGYAILAALHVTVIAGAVSMKFLKAFFQWRFLCTIGKYSYGMYIIHQLARPALPLLIDRLAPNAASIPFTAVLCSAGWFFAVFLMAKASFTYFESRFLKLKDRFSYA